MAENQAGEREHQATSKRLTELRKIGQVARSRDLTSGIIFLTGIILIVAISQHLSYQIENNFRFSFENIKTVMSDSNFPGNILHKVFYDNALLVLPLIFILFASVFLSPFIFGGWNFSLEALKFKLDNLDLIKNLGRIFSAYSLVEIIKSSVKLLLIASALLFFILTNKENIFRVSQLPLKPGVGLAFTLIKQFIITISSGLVLVVIFDIMIAYFRFQRQAMMTTQEVKEESKETEGNTDVKRKIRSRQIAIMKQRLSQTVPKANVIVTNPTHYAVALQYREKKDSAPKVIAKGKGFVAEQIRTLAILNAVPIYQAPVLARALYHTTKIGSEVHPELYMSVAIVLSYIHQLRNFQQGLGKMPPFVSDLKVPADFIYEE